jgi:2-hydroxy-6-oxonona-2,4-dienedioate hydrolase
MLQIDGRAVRVWRGGAGAPLILLQGGMADAQLHWAPVWDELAGRFEVIAPDWPGFGGSAPLPLSTYPAMLAWLSAFQAATAAGSADLAGNSFGGTMALLHAAARPREVRRLILINGGGLPSPETAQAIRATPLDGALLDEVGRAAFSRDALARMVADEAILTDAFVAACQSNPIILKVLREGLSGPMPTSMTPSAPTLVLWGAEDKHTPPRMGQEVAAKIPRGAFALIPQAGHLPQLENPAAVIAAVTAFLVDPSYETVRP